MTATDRTEQADLIGWLRKQIDADEVLARRASTVSPAPWRVDTSVGAVRDAHGAQVAGQWRALPALAGTVAPDHIVAWDPIRVLVEVEAKRRILDLHHGDFPYDDPEDGPGAYAWTERCQCCHEATPCPTVRILAEPYAHHPGYQEAWRP